MVGITMALSMSSRPEGAPMPAALLMCIPKQNTHRRLKWP